MNKQWTKYIIGLASLSLLFLTGCTNDDVRVTGPNGLLVTATPEVTPTPNPLLVDVPTEWTDGVMHFPINSVDTDGLTIEQTRKKILTKIQALYPENAATGCYADIAAYKQKIMYSFANLFAHPSSDGVPFDQIAADAGIRSDDTSTSWTAAVPELFTFTENYAAISIPNQHICASHYDSHPSLYIFDRQQNVYRTNVYGLLRKAQPVDNGLILTLETAASHSDSFSASYAHIITNTEPMQADVLGRYRTYWSRFFETEFDWFTISPDDQTISIHHVLGTMGEKAELPCEPALDPGLQIGEVLVKTEFTRQDDQYVEGETHIIEVLTIEVLEGNNGIRSETLDNWQSYCLSE